MRLALQPFSFSDKFVIDFEQLFVFHAVSFPLKSYSLHFLFPLFSFLLPLDLHRSNFLFVLVGLAVEAFLQNGYLFGVYLI